MSDDALIAQIRKNEGDVAADEAAKLYARRKVTAVSMSSESGDLYADAWEGHLSSDEIRAKIEAEYGDEAEYICVDEAVHKLT